MATIEPNDPVQLKYLPVYFSTDHIMDSACYDFFLDLTGFYSPVVSMAVQGVSRPVSVMKRFPVGSTILFPTIVSPPVLH